MKNRRVFGNYVFLMLMVFVAVEAAHGAPPGIKFRFFHTSPTVVIPCENTLKPPTMAVYAASMIASIAKEAGIPTAPVTSKCSAFPAFSSSSRIPTWMSSICTSPKIVDDAVTGNTVTTRTNLLALARDCDENFFNFSIVSANHSHNFPTAFAHYAFKHAIENSVSRYGITKAVASQKKRFIISFDFHSDSGGDKTRVRSSAWRDAAAIAETGYFHASGSVALGVNGKATSASTDWLSDVDGATLWRTVKAANDLNNGLIYITWDRDVSRDALTAWSCTSILEKPGFNESNISRKIVEFITAINLDTTGRNIIVGFDVTGLPEYQAPADGYIDSGKFFTGWTKNIIKRDSVGGVPCKGAETCFTSLRTAMANIIVALKTGNYLQ
ncbi:MAG: hypothetical protein HQM10_23605 [Candidatus Riflebacteria bacterium]|nr:hypothetical protein [Candidatus Riflebacteria bacterium]